ncbi:uncharacterized protein [Dermacentor andersoni]|uniref:uncharacterized protein isoform X1 n=1 Tax=Dermacentor andersoni TaxID=34620 RepID=UPI002155F290|nr:uncharacterized protein LOC126534424 isoform X1 [Dermacentor andersoni]
MFGTSLVILFFLSIVNGDLKNCEPDPRDAIIYANQLARAIKHFMKNCMGIMDCFKGRPSINLFIEFFGNGCDIMLGCAKKLGTEDMRQVSKCSLPIFWSNNNATGVFTQEEMECIKNAAECAQNAIPNVAVAKLVLSYFRRMLG